MVDPRIVRAALRARAQVVRLEAKTAELEAAAGIDHRALAIARAKLGPSPDPAHAAILEVMTVSTAANLCGTTPDQLRKAWATGAQFRPARSSWRRALARFGVPLGSWRDRP